MGISSIVKGLSKFLKGPSGKGFIAGLGTFFSFEWLTSGGLVRSTGGALGVSDSVASLILIVIGCLGLYVLFLVLDRKFGITDRRGRRR